MPSSTKTSRAKSAKSEQPHPLYETTRRVLLAAVGALAFAQDDIEDFVNRLVERGELAEKEGNQLVDEIMEKRKQFIQKAEERVTRRMESLFDRMNVPSKADFEALSAKIANLSEKVDQLNKS